MTALQTINLGTAPAGSDGDTVRSAFGKLNSNVAVLASQASLTSVTPITSAQALTAAHIGKRVNIVLSAPGTVNLPPANAGGTDSVITIRNTGTTIVTLAIGTGSGDNAIPLSKLNPGESAVLDTDGVHTWSVLLRSRTNLDNEVVNGNCSVGGNETIAGTLGVTGLTTLTGGASFGASGQATISAAGAYSGASAAYTGNVTVGGTLGVTGATTLSGTVTATGAVTMSSNANVGGNLAVTGGVEVGSTTATGTGYVDLHSSGSANDYDARMSATGGTSGTVGNADLTVAAGTISLVPRGQTGMKLNASGQLLIGTTTTEPAGNHIDGFAYRPGAGISVFAASSNPALVIGASNTSLGLFFNGAGTAVGSITTNGSSVAYNTTSDYRLKTNYAPLSAAADILSLIRFYEGEFIALPGESHHYVIAHELQDVLPFAVHGDKDAVDGAGKIVPQVVDYSKLVPLLGAALQDALGRIAILESKVS